MSAYYSTGRSISDIISDTYEELQDEGASPILEEKEYDEARDKEWEESHPNKETEDEEETQTEENNEEVIATPSEEDAHTPSPQTEESDNLEQLKGEEENGLRKEEEKGEIEPHKSLNAEERELFKSCKSVSDAKKLLASYADRTSKQAQQAFTRMSQQYQDRIRALEENEDKKSLDNLKENMQAIYGEDFDFKKRLNDLAKWDEYLYSNPVAAIKELANSKGVKIQIIPNGTTAKAIDPRYVELQRENAKLRKAQQEQANSLQRQEYEVAQADVYAFMNAKDPDGNLKFPGVRYIENQMVPIVKNLKANRPGYTNAQYLEAAYESIVKDDPFIQSLRKPITTPQNSYVQNKKPAKEASSLSQTSSSITPVEKKPEFKNTMDAIQYSYRQLLNRG